MQKYNFTPAKVDPSGDININCVFRKSANPANNQEFIARGSVI